MSVKALVFDVFGTVQELEGRRPVNVSLVTPSSLIL